MILNIPLAAGKNGKMSNSTLTNAITFAQQAQLKTPQTILYLSHQLINKIQPLFFF